MKLNKEAIEQIKIGDEKICGLLMQKCGLLARYEVKRYAGNREDIKEIRSILLSKTWIAICSKSAAEWTNFDSWLWKVARTTTIDYYQALQCLVEYNEGCEEHNSVDYLDKLYLEEMIEAVREAIERLRGKKKEVIKSRWQDGINSKEIANGLHTTRNNVDQLHKRALEDLRRFLIRNSAK